jgi:hypothetical protein
MFYTAPNAATKGGGPGAVGARNANTGGDSAPPASGIFGLTIYPNLIRPRA